MDTIKAFVVFGPTGHPYNQTLAPDSTAAILRFMEVFPEYMDKGWKQAVKDHFTVERATMTIIETDD